jgi:hypothetical protein
MSGALLWLIAHGQSGTLFVVVASCGIVVYRAGAKLSRIPLMKAGSLYEERLVIAAEWPSLGRCGGIKEGLKWCAAAP